MSKPGGPFGPFGSPFVLGVVLFMFSTALPPFDDLTTVDLTSHMLQHVIIIIAGVLIGYPLFKRGLFKRLEGTKVPPLALLAVIVVVTFWHLPDEWDAAVLNPLIHALEHLSFLAVGILIGSILRLLSDYSKINSLLLAFFAHMGYGYVLISPLNVHVYPLYPLSNQFTLGIAILSPGPAYWAGVIYLALRNRSWFQEGSGDEKVVKVQPPPKEHRWRRAAASGTSVMLIVILVGYYAASAAAVTLPGQQTEHASVVHIEETPISWQYSPQNIRVVVGVNNTVVWISRSISYDTVTAASGDFSSGPIPPGGSFTYTFAQPGSFRYYCIYHPWMVGYVTVSPGSTAAAHG